MPTASLPMSKTFLLRKRHRRAFEDRTFPDLAAGNRFGQAAYVGSADEGYVVHDKHSGLAELCSFSTARLRLSSRGVATIERPRAAKRHVPWTAP